MKWEQLKQSTLKEIIAWAADQTWCQAMADCAQDAKWHAEGDVWTHTQLVLHQLTELTDWPELMPDEKVRLIFTALFHDVAKPLTTVLDPVTGHVSSPKHAVKGEHVARGVLRELGCDLMTREEICRLVRYHGRPAFLLEKAEPTHEVVKLSWLVSNKLLYLFALADTRGRDTDSMSRPEENLYFWKELSKETGCYESPYSFASDHARFTFFHQAEPNLHYVPYENFRSQVTVMAGLPGSGKDAWLASNRQDLPVVSLDELRDELGINPTDNQGKLAQVARERCKELLRAGQSFAFNATNTMRSTRKRWIDLFTDYDARIEIVYLEPPFDRLLQQNKSRVKAVPERVLSRLAERCEVPTWLECHQLLMHDGTNSYASFDCK